ncbi:glycosyltransferase family 2 protein [Roseobacter litoralis]|uniref:glycosyltransferase family 2 protein n=1 Tax=Roseobacter litoralis TaxID=42443 RepID=UPI0024945B9B|nr:glycosyltransferase family 2 protein [Roseobacter litoralis]
MKSQSFQHATSRKATPKVKATDFQVAVIIPCYNEETAIGRVVEAFRAVLPSADIYVYDNNSTDSTIEVAKEAGAIVRSEQQQGKGSVVRRMFSDVDADCYLLVDGDNTYEAAAAPRLIDYLIQDGLDMVTGSRVSEIKEAYRQGHRFGNWLLTSIVTSIFGRRTTDMLSGYRVMSRRFVKSFPALSRGFEIETELTVHALELRLPIADCDTVYIDRLPGSESKLSTFKDGFRILSMIVRLVKEERPFQFFSILSAVLMVIALVLGIPIIQEFLETGLVPRFPSAILSASIVIIAILMFLAGIILDSVTLGRREIKRLHYLSYRSMPPEE